MPSEASLPDLEVKTSSLWFRPIMSLTVGQSCPFFGIRDTGNQNFLRPAASKTFVRPRGEVT
ncbi:unnamed protein product [Spirodela intermedia]|uniref:Uncharacterized protein n=1 Tax=Spirodela intermedia TaxID=51605 RepID=A0A7I8KHD7_SPIIN|nr:unnamed protein product [Spirodela intermedia]